MAFSLYPDLTIHAGYHGYWYWPRERIVARARALRRGAVARGRALTSGPARSADGQIDRHPCSAAGVVAEMDRSRAVVQGVLDEVSERLLDASRIGGHRGPWCGADDERSVLCAHARAKAHGDAVESQVV